MKILQAKLDDLRADFLERIKNGQYNIIQLEIENDGYYRVEFRVDETYFRWGFPDDLRHIIEYDGGLKIFTVSDLGESDSEIAEILFKRHFEIIKRQKIAAKIKELQKQLI